MSQRLSLRDKVRFWLVEKSIDGGWEQATLADLMGISAKHMNLIWHGKSGMSWEMADRWAETIGVKLIVQAEDDLPAQQGVSEGG